MDEAALWEYLLQMGIDTPDKLQEFALSGNTPEMLGMAGQDYSTGLGLSQTPGAEGQRVGGTYVAANPLEHLATAMQRVQGGRQMQAARGQQNALIQALAKQKGNFLNGMTNGMQPQVPVPNPQPVPQPEMQDPFAAMWPTFNPGQ